MHVLFVTQQWEPEKGVPQRRARWMIDQLLERGHDVTVVAPPPHYPKGRLASDRDEDQPGATSKSPSGEWVYRSSFVPHSQSILSRLLDQGVVSASSILKGLKAARSTRFDIVISTAPPLPAAYTATMIAKRIKAPLVLDLRDAWPELVEHVFDFEKATSRVRRAQQSTMMLPLRLAASAFGHIVKNADGVITTSSWHCNQLRDVRTAPTTVLSNLVLIDDTNSHIDTKRSKDVVICDSHTDGLTDRPLRVLYTGTVGRAQGLANAVEAAEIVHLQGTRIELRIIGDGVDSERVRELSKHLDYIEVLGRIPRAQIAEQQQWADTLLVHLRDWAPLEMTIPSKLFEAIASGKHVTVAANGEGAQLIRSAGVGDSVPAMNARALAELWIRLARDRGELLRHYNGQDWLRALRAKSKPEESFVSFVEGIANAQ